MIKLQGSKLACKMHEEKCIGMSEQHSSIADQGSEQTNKRKEKQGMVQ